MGLRDVAAISGIGETSYRRGEAQGSSLSLTLQASLAAIADEIGRAHV